MTKNLLICLFTLFGLHNGIAQTITGKIVDAQDGQGLPYSGIAINDTENIISSEEGFFTVPGNITDDALLTISYLGYNTARITVGELKQNSIVKLQSGAYELEAVYVTNVKVNADSIMAAVKKNLKNNYKVTGDPISSKVFYREGLAFKPIKLKAEMTEATGYKKNEIKAANAELKAFASGLISHPPQEFTDMLFNYHTATKTYKNKEGIDKQGVMSKFEVVKAVQLKDKTRGIDINELEKMASGILFRHLDTNKYYRIKSGLLGTRDTVVANGTFYESYESRKYAKNSINNSKLNKAKGKVTSFMWNNSLQNSKFDFVNNQELYEYSYAGTAQSGNNESILIIKFKPKKRKAKYAGTLYVSEKDYAVVRAEYVLGEGKTLGGVNLKFLFGVKQSDNVSRGTLIFKELSADKGYYLQYGSHETGQYIYINRPLKFKEITEGDKHEVAFDVKVEANVIEREEYFVMSKEKSTEANYDSVKESDFEFIQLGSYDPNIWKEYGAMEPLEEMKQFRSVE